MPHSKEIKWIMFVITAIGNFIAMLDSTSVNLALYPMSVDLKIPLSQAQWVVVAYMLVLTVFLPLFGKFGDIFPKNKLYASGFLTFAVGALLCSFADNFVPLVVFRCVEALGASVMLSNAQGIIATIFKNARRGKALGLNGGLIAVGGMLGPAIGGIIIHYFGWNCVFLTCVPIALLGAFFSNRILPSVVFVKKDFKFDYIGFIYFFFSLFALLLAISQGYHWGWTSLKILFLGFVTVIFGAVFYIRDRRISYPLINFAMFKIRPFAFGNLAVMLSYMAMFTNSVLLPFYLMEILKFNAFKSGLLILPYSVTLSVTAPIAGYLAGKYGSRLLTLLGPSVYILALGIFSSFNQITPIWLIIFASSIMGIGNGLFQSPSNNAIMTCVQKKDLGIAGGILALSRNMGNILGVATTISLFEAFKHSFLTSGIRYSDAFLMSYHITMRFGILFGFSCLISAYVAYLPQKITK